MARDAIAILDAEHVDRAHVVGHSMGGIIAQEIEHFAPRTGCDNDHTSRIEPLAVDGRTLSLGTMQPHFLASACVIAALIGACDDDRAPLGAGGNRGTTAGTAGVGGGGQGHQSGGGRDGTTPGSAGAAGTSPGDSGAGGGAGTSGGAGGSSSGIPNCAGPIVNGLPCATAGSLCASGPCEACSDRYWRLGRTTVCQCGATGVWMCSPLVPGPGGGDCIFDPPLDCPLAQSLYEDAACQTHPPCTDNP